MLTLAPTVLTAAVCKAWAAVHADSAIWEAADLSRVSQDEMLRCAPLGREWARGCPTQRRSCGSRSCWTRPCLQRGRVHETFIFERRRFLVAACAHPSPSVTKWDHHSATEWDYHFIWYPSLFRPADLASWQ